MWHFSQSLRQLVYVVWFLPVWLGIADGAAEGWGIALFGFAFTPGDLRGAFHR